MSPSCHKLTVTVLSFNNLMASLMFLLDSHLYFSYHVIKNLQRPCTCNLGTSSKHLKQTRYYLFIIETIHFRNMDIYLDFNVEKFLLIKTFHIIINCIDNNCLLCHLKISMYTHSFGIRQARCFPDRSRRYL